MNLRLLPLVGVAGAGVLAINALAGAEALPDLLSGAKAFAEEAAKPAPGKGAAAEKAADSGEIKLAANTAASPVPGKLTAAAKPGPAVCAPTAAELAKQAGLSPAELQVLQSLGTRRGQLDQREQDLQTQLALMAAAEAKLDAKIKAMNALKANVEGMLAQADQRKQAEADRLVKVFEGMKPKDAAPRMVLLDDSVRLPIAAKMKERALSAILAQMPPTEAKKLTESLAKRFTPPPVAQVPLTPAAPPAPAKASAPAAPAKPAPQKVAKAAPPAAAPAAEAKPAAEAAAPPAAD